MSGPVLRRFAPRPTHRRRALFPRSDRLASTEPVHSSHPGQRLHAIAVELAAMAQNGLHYATDRYDLARYRRLQGAAADILGVLGDCDAGPLRSALAAERGHATGEGGRTRGAVRPGRAGAAGA